MKKVHRPEYKAIEKDNPLAVHALFGQNIVAAKKWLEEIMPKYVSLGYYTDKTLTKESFEIVYR